MTDQTFPLSGPISLECKFGFGSLTVQAVDGLTDAFVGAVARDPGSDILNRLDVSLDGSTLVVAGSRPTGGWFDLPSFMGRHDERDAVDITIRVPTGTPVKAGTFSADITLDGRFGDTDLASGTSEVRVGTVDGELRVRSGAGPVEADRVSGALTVKSGACDLRVGAVGASAELAFGTGSVTIDHAGGPVRVRSGNGSVELGGVRDDVDVVTGAGSLTLALDPGVQAKLDVVTGMGRLHSDLPVSKAPSAGRAVTIRARTGKGDVLIRRAKAEQQAG